jgi:hypothetical protein
VSLVGFTDIKRFTSQLKKTIVAAQGCPPDLNRRSLGCGKTHSTIFDSATTQHIAFTNANPVNGYHCSFDSAEILSQMGV